MKLTTKTKRNGKERDIKTKKDFHQRKVLLFCTETKPRFRIFQGLIGSRKI